MRLCAQGTCFLTAHSCPMACLHIFMPPLQQDSESGIPSVVRCTGEHSDRASGKDWPRQGRGQCSSPPPPMIGICAFPQRLLEYHLVARELPLCLRHTGSGCTLLIQWQMGLITTCKGKLNDESNNNSSISVISLPSCKKEVDLACLE